MTHKELDYLVKFGQLKAEEATPEEIAGLIRSGLARLKADSQDTHHFPIVYGSQGPIEG